MINIFMLLETGLLFIITGSANLYLSALLPVKLYYYPALFFIIVFQGLLFYRLYIIGHEASHGILFPGNIPLNNFIGAMVLLPILTPLPVFRKIHQFHHSYNRLSPGISTLDTVRVSGGPENSTGYRGILQFFIKLYHYIIWYIKVFFGGFFIYNAASVILFLFLPVQFARKISPAFEGWSSHERVISIFLTAGGILLHLTVYNTAGYNIYLSFLGLPFISFAWVLSVMLYIFHYRTTLGSPVHYNARSLKHSWLLSWILLNFNEHTTHHKLPFVPWYQLHRLRKNLPKDYADYNKDSISFTQAILQQLKGPVIIYNEDSYE
jgi:fatty acid desaturase